MVQVHFREKEQFQKLFEQAQIDRFEDRLKILEVFLQTERHLTVENLMARLSGNGLNYSVDFVHDTLRLMCHYGFAQKYYFDNGLARYEHRHLSQHHDHMICTKCGKIIEFQDPDLERRQQFVTDKNGFHMLQHKMEIYGICSDCLKERAGLIPLVTAKPGETIRIVELTGGKKSRIRLKSMGIRVGDLITVITNRSTGQVVVAMECSRYVLGRGLSQTIMGEPVDPETVGGVSDDCLPD